MNTNKLAILVAKYPQFLTAYNEAQKSDYQQRLGSVCCNKRKVLSTGYNQIRYCGRGNKYAKFEETLHAERDCLRKLDKEIVKGKTLFILRVKKNNDLALAKPCDQCMWMIRELGIREVIYTVPEYPYYERIKTGD
jgi:deoxycytidylate deaminase